MGGGPGGGPDKRGGYGPGGTEVQLRRRRVWSWGRMVLKVGGTILEVGYSSGGGMVLEDRITDCLFDVSVTCGNFALQLAGIINSISSIEFKKLFAEISITLDLLSWGGRGVIHGRMFPRALIHT